MNHTIYLAQIPLMIGGTEIIVIAAVILLLFGGKKIPELMRSMGQGVRYFKKGVNEDLLQDKASSTDLDVKLPDEDQGENDKSSK
jgi:sec-independent protein translocase protein TatA